MNCFFQLIISIFDGSFFNSYDVMYNMLQMKYENLKFKFSAKIHLDEVTMTYVGLFVTSERSTMPISSGVYIPVMTLVDTSKLNMQTKK